MKHFTSFLMVFVTLLVHAQEVPLFVEKATSFRKVSPISSKSKLTPFITKGKVEDGRSSKNNVIIGKDPQISNDWYTLNRHALTNKVQTREAELVFVGAESDSQPTDPSLAVGPNHVFVVFNTGFKIYDKEGNALTSQLAPSNIFGTDGCCDLTISYDNLAERWVASLLGNGAYVAVSSTSDPVNAEWYVYTYSQVSDYQKLSVWSDGYYMTDNTNSSNNVYVFERDKMIAGDSNAQIIGFPLTGLVRDGFYSPQVFNIASDVHPAPGNAPIVFLQDDAWADVSEDHLKLWTINVDWDVPANSTISEPIELATTPFISVFDGGSFSNLQQPNGGEQIDALQSTIMNQAQFRKFSNYNSAVFSFVVDTDASGGELAGVRWYELRQSADGQPWEIYQEGTYTSPNQKHAWNGSLSLDAQGNIALGYTGMGGTTNTVVSSYYTGRRLGDPLNTMTFEESVIMEGDENIPGYRYGDYAKMDIDPVDGKKFWFITEVMNNGRKDVVGAFQLAPDYDNDLGVVSINTPVSGDLSTTETVTITITNYGEQEQSNFPVQLYLDGNLVATETFTGVLEPGANVEFTFNTTLNLGIEGQVYTIMAGTNLDTDEDNSNDTTTVELVHLYSNDVGVTAILSPESGSSLGEQTFTVTIKNYGSQTQTEIPVYYSVNGGANVVETFTGALATNQEVNYTFSSTYNFSTFGDFTLIAGSQLNPDSVTENNTIEKGVSNLSCLNNKNEADIAIMDNETVSSVTTINESALINDLNITLNIDHTYDGDLDIWLKSPDGTIVSLIERVGNGGENFENTILDDEADVTITSGTAPFTGDFKPIEQLSTFDGLNMQGDWTLYIKDNYSEDQGVLNDWTLNICSNDFLSTDETIRNNISFDVAHKGDEKYLVQLDSEGINGKVNLEVFNMEGKLLLSRKLDNNGTNFTYDLDMSYATSGVYIVRMSNKEVSATKRIIVK